MAIPTTIESLSTTAASNGPAGSEQRTLADDGLRQAYAFVKQLVSVASLASGSTITPPSTAKVFNITGTTTINTIASTNSWDGREITLIFAGALTLTHSSNLALPGSTSITTAANDAALFTQTGSGAWRCIAYLRADGSLTLTGNLTVNGNTTLGNAGTDTTTVNGNVTINAPSSGTTLTVQGIAIGTASGAFTDGTNTLSLLGNGVTSNVNGSLTINASAATGQVVLRTNSADRMVATSDGRFYGIALHNNAGAVTGTTNQYIASGTYTPTLTNTTNVAASTAAACQWMRVGNVVTVSGKVSIDVTSASTQTELGMSLPIASGFTAEEQLGGTAASGNSGETQPAEILADATNDRAMLRWQVAGAIGNNAWSFSFTYLIV